MTTLKCLQGRQQHTAFDCMGTSTVAGPFASGYCARAILLEILSTPAVEIFALSATNLKCNACIMMRTHAKGPRCAEGCGPMGIACAILRGLDDHEGITAGSAKLLQIPPAHSRRGTVAAIYLSVGIGSNGGMLCLLDTPGATLGCLTGRRRLSPASTRDVSFGRWNAISLETTVDSRNVLNAPGLSVRRTAPGLVSIMPFNLEDLTANADDGHAPAVDVSGLAVAMLIAPTTAGPSATTPDDTASAEIVVAEQEEGAGAPAVPDRFELLRSKPMELTVPTLIDAYAASVVTHVRVKPTRGGQLPRYGWAQFVPVASFASSILSSKDHSTLVVGALQLVDLLLAKVPALYKPTFHRERVFHEIEVSNFFFMGLFGAGYCSLKINCNAPWINGTSMAQRQVYNLLLNLTFSTFLRWNRAHEMQRNKQDVTWSHGSGENVVKKIKIQVIKLPFLSSVPSCSTGICEHNNVHVVSDSLRRRMRNIPAVATAIDDTQNIEKDVDEFYNGSGITWKLSALEARTIAAPKMVVFDPDTNCPTDAIKLIIPRLAAAPVRESARVRIGNERPCRTAERKAELVRFYAGATRHFYAMSLLSEYKVPFCNLNFPALDLFLNVGRTQFGYSIQVVVTLKAQVQGHLLRLTSSRRTDLDDYVVNSCRGVVKAKQPLSFFRDRLTDKSGRDGWMQLARAPYSICTTLLDERVLIVWWDDNEAIMPRPEETLMRLVWRASLTTSNTSASILTSVHLSSSVLPPYPSRPRRPPATSTSPTGPEAAAAAAAAGEKPKEKSSKWWWSWKLSKAATPSAKTINDPERQGPASPSGHEAHAMRMFAPFYGGLGAGLAFGITVLLQEWRLDHDYRRFGRPSSSVYQYWCAPFLPSRCQFFALQVISGGIAFAMNLTPEEFTSATPQAKTEDANANALQSLFFDPPAGAGTGPIAPKRASHNRKPSPPALAPTSSPNNDNSGSTTTTARPRGAHLPPAQHLHPPLRLHPPRSQASTIGDATSHSWPTMLLNTSTSRERRWVSPETFKFEVKVSSEQGVGTAMKVASKASTAQIPADEVPTPEMESNTPRPLAPSAPSPPTISEAVHATHKLCTCRRPSPHIAQHHAACMSLTDVVREMREGLRFDGVYWTEWRRNAQEAKLDCGNDEQSKQADGSNHRNSTLWSTSYSICRKALKKMPTEVHWNNFLFKYLRSTDLFPFWDVWFKICGPSAGSSAVYSVNPTELVLAGTLALTGFSDRHNCIE
ncbi:hypothetical protein B0H11DRAFT_1900576 [Mycena galericulata]|nr:hypothetical protein B0H11DRAFT_1900576 [Mycena galericulata]